MKELKVKMTMYIPMNKDEDAGEVMDRLDRIAFDNNLGYQVYETEIQEMEE